MNKKKQVNEITSESSSEERFSLKDASVENKESSESINCKSSQELKHFCYLDSASFRSRNIIFQINNGTKNNCAPKRTYSMPELADSETLIAMRSCSAIELRHTYITSLSRDQAISALIKKKCSDLSNDFWGFLDNICYENGRNYSDDDEILIHFLRENERTDLGKEVEEYASTAARLFGIRKLNLYSLPERKILSVDSKNLSDDEIENMFCYSTGNEIDKNLMPSESPVEDCKSAFSLFTKNDYEVEKENSESDFDSAKDVMKFKTNACLQTSLSFSNGSEILKRDTLRKNSSSTGAILKSKRNISERKCSSSDEETFKSDAIFYQENTEYYVVEDNTEVDFLRMSLKDKSNEDLKEWCKCPICENIFSYKTNIQKNDHAKVEFPSYETKNSKLFDAEYKQIFHSNISRGNEDTEDIPVNKKTRDRELDTEEFIRAKLRQQYEDQEDICLGKKIKSNQFDTGKEDIIPFKISHQNKEQVDIHLDEAMTSCQFDTGYEDNFLFRLSQQYENQIHIAPEEEANFRQSDIETKEITPQSICLRNKNRIKINTSSDEEIMSSFSDTESGEDDNDFCSPECQIKKRLNFLRRLKTKPRYAKKCNKKLFKNPLCPFTLSRKRFKRKRNANRNVTRVNMDEVFNALLLMPSYLDKLENRNLVPVYNMKIEESRLFHPIIQNEESYALAEKLDVNSRDGDDENYMEADITNEKLSDQSTEYFETNYVLHDNDNLQLKDKESEILSDKNIKKVKKKVRFKIDEKSPSEKSIIERKGWFSHL